MATIAQFSNRMRIYGNRVRNNSVVAVRRAAKVTLKELVRGTPVDKGVARSNWRVSLGQPTRAVIGAYAPGRKLGIGETANARAAIQAGNAVIDRHRARNGPNSIFISNNVPYLDRLRFDSYSPQQPIDWVPLAISAGFRETDNVRLLERSVGSDEDAD